MKSGIEIRFALNLIDQAVRAEAICRVMGVTLDEALSDSHAKEFVHARHAILLALHEAGHAYARIARIFGLNHTTVMHGCKAARLRRSQMSRRAEQAVAELIESETVRAPAAAELRPLALIRDTDAPGRVGGASC